MKETIIKIGNVFLINDDDINIVNVIKNYEEKNNIKTSIFNILNNEIDIWLSDKVEKKEYINKFIFWLNKNGWKEVTNNIINLNIL